MFTIYKHTFLIFIAGHKPKIVYLKIISLFLFFFLVQFPIFPSIIFLCSLTDEEKHSHTHSLTKLVLILINVNDIIKIQHHKSILFPSFNTQKIYIYLYFHFFFFKFIQKEAKVFLKEENKNVGQSVRTIFLLLYEFKIYFYKNIK